MFIAERDTYRASSHIPTGTPCALDGHCPSLHWERGERSKVLRGRWGDHEGILELEEKVKRVFFTSCLVIYADLSSSR